MQRCSFFIKNKALFGSYPTQESVTFLEEFGVKYFIDLTEDREIEEKKVVPYTTNYSYYRYPVRDKGIPNSWSSFAKFILDVCTSIKSLKNDEKIYLHCRGGHGRSGLVVACILCEYYKISPEESLKLTKHYHSERKEMREKWRHIGSPQTNSQKNFVIKFFKELLYSYKNEKTNKLTKSEFFTNGFDNKSSYSVHIPNVGTFPNADLAFQSFREQQNDEYIDKLKEGIFDPKLIKQNRDDWQEKKIGYMFRVLELKFSQHENLRNNLLNTGLRTLIKDSDSEFWGRGKKEGKENKESGKNIHAWILEQIRKKMLLNL